MLTIGLLSTALLLIVSSSAFMAGGPGAIFTSIAGCGGTNVNIFDDKGDVYLKGSGLPDGSYYVQVTDPSGANVLGKSTSTTVTVTGGSLASCYQLSAVVLSASSGFTTTGYDSTPNPGGGYKVWVSMDPTFPNGSKTDNFKVRSQDCPECIPQGTVTLTVDKFFDNNGNGTRDSGEPLINGWQIRIQDSIDYTRFTPVNIVLAPDNYTVTEADTVETNWVHSGGSYSINGGSAVALTSPFTSAQLSLLNDGDSGAVLFGNYCTVPSGGKTIGFWSNKNGQMLLTNADFISLTNAPLVNANGSVRDFTATFANNKTAFNSWLLNANATNMAYMLSAQLSAMKLNVAHGFVDGNAFYLPAGKTVNQIIADAETLLASSGGNNTVASGTLRTQEETVKNYIDQLNNGAAVIPVAPCSFSFAP